MRLMGVAAILATMLAACVPVTPVIGGIVQGVVYGDLNSDGIIDDSEQTSRVPGAEVLLEDCGPDQTVLTDADGKFKFQDLPEGTCHVSVSKAGWIYDGMYPVIGVYPIPVASDADLPTAFSIYMAPVMDFIPAETSTPSGPTNTPTFTPTFTLTVSADPMVTPQAEDVNCRFGPGVNYASTGALKTGTTVPILGTIDGGGWWQITNPLDVTAKCWVSASVTTATGDLGTVPIVPIPTGLVTAASVSVSSGATLHGYCGGPNAVSFSASITTNGPATVVYNVEIYNNSTGALLGGPGNVTLIFSSASTQTFDPGGAFKTDCGTFLIRLTVSSPNSKTVETTWSVVSP
ncbi:hypothetical protein EG834_11855 [bacterium]|nr:hypothetical protein [bacterium]